MSKSDRKPSSSYNVKEHLTTNYSSDVHGFDYGSARPTYEKAQKQ